MPIEATEPTEIVASYDKWAFMISTTDYPCAKPGEIEPATVGLVLSLAKFRIRPGDNVPELSPLPADYKSLRIDDIYTLASTNLKVATALQALMEAVEDVAGSEGLL